MKCIDITKEMQEAFRTRECIMTLNIAPKDCWCKILKKDYQLETVAQRAQAIKKASGCLLMEKEKGYNYAIAKNVGMIIDYFIGGLDAAKTWWEENSNIPIIDIEARFYDRVYYDVDGTEIGRQDKVRDVDSVRLIFGTFGTKKNIDEIKQYFADLKMKEIYGK